MNRKSKFIVGTAAALLLLGGCQKKVGGQVVAVVNGEEITQQELNAELQGANVPPGADKNQVMAQVLQSIVERKLLAQQARSLGLDQSPAYLEGVRRAQDTLAVSLLAEKTMKTIALPDSAAVGRYIAENPTMFSGRKRYSLDQIIFPLPADRKILAEFQPAHTLDAVVAVLTARKIPFTRSKGQLDSGSVPPDVAKRIAALPPGEPFLVPENGRVVASVIVSAEPLVTPDDQAKPAALNLLRQKAVGDAMRAAVNKARADAKIDYQPGFAPPKGTPANSPAK
ncbi:hypothetical protein BH11PSE5_BH11PSE5_10710 [soil metagenome]